MMLLRIDISERKRDVSGENVFLHLEVYSEQRSQPKNATRKAVMSMIESYLQK